MTSSEKNSSILFIYDHSLKTGNGHLRRCEYFSKIFPRRFNLEFKKYNSKIHSNLRRKIYDYIIIDSYEINFSHEKKIRNFCKKLITIDDNYNRKFASDIIINYSPLVKKKNYEKKIFKTSKLFLGKKFSFIKKKNFIKKIKKKHLNKNKLNIFIYFGTKDGSYLIKKILKRVSNKKIFKKIYVFDKKRIIPHKIFLEKIKDSDLMLISSGVTLQEGLNMKKMIFATSFSKNQKNFYKYYKKKNLIKDLSNFNHFINFEIEKIHSILKKNQLKIEKYFKQRINKKKMWSLINNA